MIKYYIDLRTRFMNRRYCYRFWSKKKALLLFGAIDLYLFSYLYYRYLFKNLRPEEQKRIELEQNTPMTKKEIEGSLNFRVTKKAYMLFVYLLPFKAVLSYFMVFGPFFFYDDAIYIKRPEVTLCTFSSVVFTFTPIHLPYCYGMPIYRNFFQPNFLEEERVREARRNCYFSLMRDAYSCSYYLDRLDKNGEYDKAQRFLDRWDPIRLKNKDHPGYCISNMRILLYYRSIDDLDKAKKYEEIFEGCREEAGL